MPRIAEAVPELPEVETTMRALAVRLEHRRFVLVEQRRPDLRFTLPQDLPARLVGRRLVGFARRAKFIELMLDDGQTLLLHLGMSGRLVFDGTPAGPHEHLTFHFDDGTVLRFIDPRRFGMLDLWPTAELAGHKWLRHLGLEPRGNSFDGSALLARLAGRQVALKVAIMDQRHIVGVGNIYASESLYRAGLSPRRLAASVGPERARRLAASIREVLLEAIDAGGSSLRDYVQSNGELGNFQRMFRVYDRAGLPCPVCTAPIRRLVQAGRATFYCGKCQH
jgi:formamidopyrimidine-DNA glycosylase